MSDLRAGLFWRIESASTYSNAHRSHITTKLQHLRSNRTECRRSGDACCAAQQSSRMHRLWENSQTQIESCAPYANPCEFHSIDQTDLRWFYWLSPDRLARNSSNAANVPKNSSISHHYECICKRPIQRCGRNSAQNVRCASRQRLS